MNLFKAVSSVLSKVSAGSFGLLIVAAFLAFGQLNAQGWVKKIGGSGLDQAEDLLTTKDGGFVLLNFVQSVEGDRINLVRMDIDGTTLWSKTYGSANVHGFKMVENADGSLLIAGDRKASPQSSNNIYLLKVNQRGELLWDKELMSQGNQTARNIIAASEGGYLLAGQTDATDSGETDALLIRIDENGNENWSKTFGQDKDDSAYGLTEVADGFVFTGVSDNPDGPDNDIILYKIDKAGETVWNKRIATPEAEEAHSVVTTPDNAVVLAGFQGNSSDILVAKYSITGDSLWTSTLDNIGMSDQASFIRMLDNGNFILTGISELTASNIDAFVAEIDGEGMFKWLKTLGPAETFDQPVSVDVTLDGGFIIASTSTPLAELIDDVLLIKTDASLNTLTNKIEGEIVLYEGADDCETIGNVELFQNRWIVTAQQGNTTFFGTTDDNGKFNIEVDSGQYVLSAYPYSGLWYHDCPNDKVVNFDRLYDTTINVVLRTLDQEVQEEQEADLRVDVSAPFINEGGLVVYDVVVFNEGTATSDETTSKVEIQLDEELTYVKSVGNAPNEDTSDIANGNLVYFLSGIERGQSHKFQIHTQARPGGDDMRPAQAVSVSAKASALNNIDLRLEQDVKVEINTVPGLAPTVGIRNVGIGTINSPLSAVVIQDDIGFLKEITPDGDGLEPDDVLPIEFGAEDPIDLTPNGQTLRVIATIDGQQGLNGFGSQAVEPVGRDEDNDYMTGFVSMFPEDDQERNFVIDVEENIGSDQAFEMRGYPKGYRDTIVAPNTDLTYKIIFKNLGTDSINRLVIRDTLSEFLDPSTVTPGASNLPYQFELDDKGIVKFTFDEVILLPGSSTDLDTSSYGYVKFVVSQKPNLPIGSVIQNRAAVFFDYQEPQTTNEVTRIVGEYPEFIEFLVTDIEEPEIEGVEINVYPNPFIDGTTFELKGKDFGEVTLRIFDLEGKLIESYQHSGNKFMYYRNQKLPSGMYLYRLESEGQLINSGKLLVR